MKISGRMESRKGNKAGTDNAEVDKGVWAVTAGGNRHESKDLLWTMSSEDLLRTK
jgi:hypothetical protein